MPSNDLLCGGLIKRISENMERNANRDLQVCGVTLAQVQMLLVLNRVESASLKELEHYFGVAQSTVAGIAIRLERKQLVLSSTDTADRRAKRLQITDAGREICRKADRFIHGAEAGLLSGLTPEEQTEFARLLQKVYLTME